MNIDNYNHSIHGLQFCVLWDFRTFCRQFFYLLYEGFTPVRSQAWLFQLMGCRHLRNSGWDLSSDHQDKLIRQKRCPKGNIVLFLTFKPPNNLPRASRPWKKKMMKINLLFCCEIIKKNLGILFSEENINFLH